MGVIQAVVQVEGKASGALVFSDQPMSFWGGYDASTGEMIDVHHPLHGESLAGAVLAVPFTIGSSTTAAVFLQSIREGKAPAAIITRGPDSFLALAAIVGEEMYECTVPIVSVSADEFELLRNVSRVEVSAGGNLTFVG